MLRSGLKNRAGQPWQKAGHDGVRIAAKWERMTFCGVITPRRDYPTKGHALVAGLWLDDLDLDGIARESIRFHAATGERREDDMVWRIPRRDGGDAYLLLLLEFQSTLDPSMALSMLVYAGLLWQHLLTEKRLLPDGRLPPILPVVLYNGDRR
jgi:hypothetical protein